MKVLSKIAFERKFSISKKLLYSIEIPFSFCSTIFFTSPFSGPKTNTGLLLLSISNNLPGILPFALIALLIGKIKRDEFAY